MKDALDQVKTVLAGKDYGARLNHYYLTGESIIASDGRMTAAVPFKAPVECVVAGEELEVVAARMPANPALELRTNDETGALTLVVKAGRLRGSIACLPPDSVSFPTPPPEVARIALPGSFVAALKAVRPFIADTSVHAWGLAACVRAGRVLATNNIVLIEGLCPELELPTDAEVLIPCWAVDYILRRKDGLTHMALEDKTAASFFWSDGSWMRTQLMAGAYPPAVDRLLSEMGETPFPIEKAFRGYFQEVVSASSGIITIEPGKITGSKGVAKLECEIDLVGATEALHFNPLFIADMMQVATEWDPSLWPAPIPFRGDGVKGLIVGRKA